jgi:hypothetical protein
MLLLRLGQFLRFRHALRKGIPRDDGFNACKWIGTGLLGFQQGMADPPI